jgi:excisionase family DNA binding protein
VREGRAGCPKVRWRGWRRISSGPSSGWRRDDLVDGADLRASSEGDPDGGAGRLLGEPGQRLPTTRPTQQPFQAKETKACYVVASRGCVVAARVARRESETYPPSAAPDGALAQLLDFIAAHEAAGRGAVAPRYFLAGSAAAGDQVELPREVYEVLHKVVDALGHGLAVTVVPQALTLTTQQAADLLGVTRPTVVKILASGAMPYERIGTHRRLLLADVLAYREQRRAEQYAALEAAAIDLDDVSDANDLDSVLAELREARRAIGQRRRGVAQD